MPLVQHARRMVETAAHLTDHVFPRLPVRQWVLSVPKRLRYFMQRDGAVLNMVLRILLRVIVQSLAAHCPDAAQAGRAHLHIGAVAFIHRFGSSLNEHVHFHVCVVDGVSQMVPSEVDADATATAPGIIFHPASGIEETVVAQVQADVRRRILRAFVGRGTRNGLSPGLACKTSGLPLHSGFSLFEATRRPSAPVPHSSLEARFAPRLVSLRQLHFGPDEPGSFNERLDQRIVLSTGLMGD